MTKVNENVLGKNHFFSIFGGNVPLKNECTHKKNDSFQNLLNSSRRKPKLIHADVGKKLLKKMLTVFLIKTKIK